MKLFTILLAAMIVGATIWIMSIVVAFLFKVTIIGLAVLTIVYGIYLLTKK